MTPSAVVLMYHRLSDGPFDPDEGDYVLSPSLFESQLRWLAAARRPVATLAQLAEGRHEDCAVVLTFDDGCDSDCTVASPLLRSLGFPAAFFVNPARVGAEGRAGWDELRTLAAHGFAIGSHGLDHTLLDGLSSADLERQIAESRRAIEDRLGARVDALSLPGGSGGERARRAALAAGYRLVLGSRPGVVRSAAGEFIVPRVAVRRGHGLAGFRAAVEKRPLFLLRLRLRYAVGHVGRRLIGAGTYGRLRRLWLGHGSQAED